MKILIYISSLTAGGAEKVASLMANFWSETHEVILLTDSSIEEDFFQIDKEITRISTNFRTSKKNILQKVWSHFSGLIQLRNIVKKEYPDVIISHMDITNVRMLIATHGLKIPVIVEDHNNPELKGMAQPWKALKPFAYKQAYRIVLLTKDLLNYYPKVLYNHNKIVFIENPLNIPKIISDSNEIFIEKPSFIALGSLTDQKGFDMLLDAYAKVLHKRPNWKLTILGDGMLRDKLMLQIKDLGLEEYVSMPGRVTNPYGVLKNASIYVMSSRFEGFPVALCEAMGVGLPCISFDCPTGPADIIQNGINGLLVEYMNVDKLSDTMLLLSVDIELQDRLASQALEINKTLNIDTIMSKWEQLIAR